MKNQLFTYQNFSVRVVTDENYEPWFAGIDVCNILEYTMPSNIIKENLDEDERMLTNLTDGSGQKRRTWIINESGLYALILSSSKPEAKQFKRWITHEVLPALRKAGIYATNGQKAKQIDLENIRKKMLVKENELIAAKSDIKELEREISKLNAEFWEMFGTDPAQLKLYPKEILNDVKQN